MQMHAIKVSYDVIHNKSNPSFCSQGEGRNLVTCTNRGDLPIMIECIFEERVWCLIKPR